MSCTQCFTRYLFIVISAFRARLSLLSFASLRTYAGYACKHALYHVSALFVLWSLHYPCYVTSVISGILVILCNIGNRFYIVFVRVHTYYLLCLPDCYIVCNTPHLPHISPLIYRSDLNDHNRGNIKGRGRQIDALY